VSHLKGHHLPVSSIVVYADDLHAVSVSLDRSIICWDLRMEKRVSTHLQRMGGLNCVELAPDETLVITAGQERRVTMWDLREHEPVSYRELSSDGSDEGRGIAVSHR
jgi:WD40 repeat protein